MDSEEENRNQRNKGHKQKNKKLEKKRDKEKDLKKAKKLKKQAYELLREEKRAAFFAQKDKKKKKQKSSSSVSSISEKSSSVSSSRSRSSSPEAKIPKNMKQNEMEKIIAQKQLELEKMEQKLQQIEHSQPVQPVQPTKRYGPCMPPDFDRKAIEDKLKQNITSKQVEQKDDKVMDQFLEGVFGGGQKGHLSQFLDTRVKQNKKSDERELKHDQVEYLGGKIENTEMSQDQLKRFMKEWDEENRGKSLMQLHQEKKRQEMIENQKQYGAGKELLAFTYYNKGGARREFNRDTDLNYFKQDSKRIMHQMQQSGSLNTKFGTGNIQNSFI